MITKVTILAMARDQTVLLAQLAELLCETEAFAAGLVDIATGDQDWRLMFDADYPATTAEREDYGRGACVAEQLIDAERRGRTCAPWYANVAAEAGRLTAPPKPPTQ